MYGRARQLLPCGVFSVDSGHRLSCWLVLHGGHRAATSVHIPAGPLLPRELDERDGHQLRAGVFVRRKQRKRNRVHLCARILLPASIYQLCRCVRAAIHSGATKYKYQYKQHIVFLTCAHVAKTCIAICSSPCFEKINASGSH